MMASWDVPQARLLSRVMPRLPTSVLQLPLRASRPQRGHVSQLPSPSMMPLMLGVKFCWVVGLSGGAWGIAHACALYGKAGHHLLEC